ncbi:Pycsar system effector family protein [Micromonospora echinofusca]|uniref:Pycsar system effector family protein n=1 Tax=Micromonospora echinofusca TaxID=47858 RepID=UPI000B5AF9B5|nr:Pycsar system effector family protein [Micromonospora echinofusca]
MTADNGWKALGQVNEWIRFADAKAAAVLAASGVLGGLLVKRIPRLADFKDEPVYAGLLVVAILCLGGAALIASRILAPRLRTGEARSLIYFDHVARRYGGDRRGYVDTFTALTADEERFERHLAEQVWANSKVARAKFRRVAVAIYLLGAAMLSSGAAVLAYRL